MYGVALASRGGSVSEAIAIGRLLRKFLLRASAPFALDRQHFNFFEMDLTIPPPDNHHRDYRGSLKNKTDYRLVAIILSGAINRKCPFRKGF
jgi:hypothetical protein